MRFPKGYAGVKKLFASEILNIISTLLSFVTSIIIIIFSKKISNPNYLPFVVIPMMAVGLTALIAFIMQLVGLNQARKDDLYFRTAFIFVFVGVAASIVSFLTGGTFGNIFESISAVASLIVSVYTILGIYDFADEMGNTNVMLHGKIALFVGATSFAVSVIFHIIPVFIPRIEYIFDLFSSVLEFAAYFVFLIYLGRAKNMLSEKA